MLRIYRFIYRIILSLTFCIKKLKTKIGENNCKERQEKTYQEKFEEFKDDSKEQHVRKKIKKKGQVRSTYGLCSEAGRETVILREDIKLCSK